VERQRSEKEEMLMGIRKRLSVLVVASALGLGMAACEAEGGGTSPGVEEPATGGGAGDLGTDPGTTGEDPLAPAEGEEGLGEG
jgi:hypothetical protein